MVADGSGRPAKAGAGEDANLSSGSTGARGDDPGPLYSVRGVRERLEAAGLRPNHRLGQNFLCHGPIVEAVAAAAELDPGDAVLEVGAGLGVLTAELVKRVQRVVAVELDRSMCQLLATAPEVRGAELVCGDILSLDDRQLMLPAAGGPFKVVANIPYYLTTALLERILGAWRQCPLAVLMVQDEVARRLMAQPGNREYGLMTVFVQYHARIELVRTVPPSAFWPRPAVQSAVIRLTRHAAPPVDADEETLLRLIAAAFGQRRKQIRNSLAGPPLNLGRAAIDGALAAAGVDGTQRAEQLSLVELARLARSL